ncbi:MAG: sigma 54-interacting transcriptional regulator [Polyangiaceae bacterium]|nr:sigma 54-interacting transcriptional regulator [Polyangiaceae bacterium]
MDRTQTLSVAGDIGGIDAIETPHLFLVLQSHRMAAPPARIRLAGLEEMILGRGPEQRIEQPNTQCIAVRTPDPWMSSTHARMIRALNRWVIEDAGSKNGSLLSGAPLTARATLEDGDIIELGHTFFVYRHALRAAPGEPPILDLAQHPAALLGFATLSPDLERDLEKLATVARAAIPVIIEGETGTGKEVLARAVHDLSGRRGELVAVNCGALPQNLVEGELFGHRRGAFSGATEDRPGLIRAADGGTLLLDEIGELPAPAQAALLRVLEAREVLPVGATKPVPVDVRVLAATHRSLDAMVEQGSFRRDLFNRLAGYRARLPPLRERIEDLGILAASLLSRIAPAGAALPAIQPKAARALLQCFWPGNIRQLEKALSSAAALAKGSAIGLEHLPDDIRAAPAEDKNQNPAGGEEAAARNQLVAMLIEHKGNVSAIARATGKARMQVQRWLKRYGLDPERYRG